MSQLTVLNQPESLYALGVRDNTLSADEKLKLDQDGYLPLYDILNKEQIRAMLEAIEDNFAREKTGTPDGPPECENLQNKSDAFDLCVSHPRVLAAIAHVLKDNIRSLGVHSRPNKPGRGLQELHADFGGPPPQDGEYWVCNSIWPLVDFTVENGATRVVPGSHRCGKNPGDVQSDRKAPHPQEIKLIAPAGSVVIFNSHLWHGATQNNSAHDRPNVTSFFGRRDPRQAMDRRSVLSRSACNRIGDPVRALFDTIE
jgi:hypothetical protein